MMYVNGEGVKATTCSVMLGCIAKKVAAARRAGIIAQAGTSFECGRSQAAWRRCRPDSGKQLAERLLPKPYVPEPLARGLASCAPPPLIPTLSILWSEASGDFGSVLVEVTVAPDGRGRNVRVLSLPTELFDEAGRRVALSNVSTPPVENGVALACTIRFKVNFAVRDVGGGSAQSREQQKLLAEARQRRKPGIRTLIVTYGLFSKCALT